MAEPLTIARPYAKAIFELAISHNAIPEWQNLLSFLSQLVSNDRVKVLLQNPNISSQQITLFLAEGLSPEWLAKQPMEHYVQNFIQLLIQNKRLLILPEIFAIYEQLLAWRDRTMKIEVISAFTIDTKLQNQLITALQQRFDSKINVDYQVDKSLIGGAIIRGDHWVLDGSLRGKLKRLNDFLINSF